MVKISWQSSTCEASVPLMICINPAQIWHGLILKKLWFACHHKTILDFKKWVVITHPIHTHTSFKDWTDCTQQLQHNCCEHGLHNTDKTKKITSFAMMYLTSFLTWAIWLKKLPDVNAKVTITGEGGGKETGKGKCRNRKMKLGQET